MDISVFISDIRLTNEYEYKHVYPIQLNIFPFKKYLIINLTKYSYVNMQFIFDLFASLLLIE